MNPLINEQELRRIIRQMVQEELQAERQRQQPGVGLTEKQLTDAGIRGLSSKQPNTFQQGGALQVVVRGEVEHRAKQIDDKEKESINI